MSPLQPPPPRFDCGSAKLQFWSFARHRPRRGQPPPLHPAQIPLYHWLALAPSRSCAHQWEHYCLPAAADVAVSATAHRRARRAHVASITQVVTGRTTTLAWFAVCPWCLSPISMVLLALWLTETLLPPLQVARRRGEPALLHPCSCNHRPSLHVGP